MPDDSPLAPATADELAAALAHALRFKGRKTWSQGAELMANITARHLIEHLERSGFVVMKRRPGDPHRSG